MGKIKLIIALVISLIVFNSCSDDDSKDSTSSNSSISDTSFGGTIDGEAYQAIDGDAFFSEDAEGNEVLSVRISNQNFDCDDDLFNDFDYVSVWIPTSTMEEQTLNVVLDIKGSSFGPINNFDGSAQIVSLTGTEAIVKIKTKSQGSNSKDSPFSNYDLEGKFTVQICGTNK